MFILNLKGIFAVKSFIFFITFILSAVAQANDLPSYNGNIDQWEKEMMIFSDWKNHHNKKSTDFDSIIKKIQHVIDDNPSRPRLRILLGRFYGYKAGVIVREAREKGIKVGEKITDPTYVDSVDGKFKSYEDALMLDNGSLSFDDYEIINYPTLGSDIRIATSRKQLKLIDEGVWPPKDIETDHPEVLANYDYTLYERIVTAYIDENRFDEALAVINNEMVERFPYKQKEIKEGVVNIEQRKERYLQEMTESEQQEEPTQTPEPQKPTAAKAPTEQPPADKAEPTPQQPVPEQSTDNSRLILIGLVLAIVILAGFMLVRRPKK